MMLNTVEILSYLLSTLGNTPKTFLADGKQKHTLLQCPMESPLQEEPQRGSYHSQQIWHCLRSTVVFLYKYHKPCASPPTYHPQYLFGAIVKMLLIHLCLQNVDNTLLLQQSIVSVIGLGWVGLEEFFLPIGPLLSATRVYWSLSYPRSNGSWEFSVCWVVRQPPLFCP